MLDHITLYTKEESIEQMQLATYVRQTNYPTQSQMYSTKSMRIERK